MSVWSFAESFLQLIYCVTVLYKLYRAVCIEPKFPLLHAKFQSHLAFCSGEEDIEMSVLYMGMAAILVMLPRPFYEFFLSPFKRRLHINFERFQRRCLKIMVIYTSFIELEPPMLHAKLQYHGTLGSGGEDFQCLISYYEHCGNIVTKIILKNCVSYSKVGST